MQLSEAEAAALVSQTKAKLRSAGFREEPKWYFQLAAQTSLLGRAMDTSSDAHAVVLFACPCRASATSLRIHGFTGSQVHGSTFVGFALTSSLPALDSRPYAAKGVRMNLVTGATGLLGSHIAAKLRLAGQEVRALVRPGADTRFLTDIGCKLAPGDVTDPASIAQAMKGVRVVYHSAAAWATGPLARVRRHHHRRHANMVQAAAAEKVQRFLHISSISAYGHVDGVGWCWTSRPRWALACTMELLQPGQGRGREARLGR